MINICFSFLFSEMFVRIFFGYRLFTIPAEILITLCTMHLVASIYFFNRTFACRTRPKFKFLSFCIEIKVEFFLTSLPLMPRFCTLKTWVFIASCTQNSICTTRFINNIVTVSCRTVLYIFTCSYLVFFISLFKLIQ